MTLEDKTTSSPVSRRTVLRTTANAAWLVPAISMASAVPAVAACSTDTVAHFGVSNPSGNHSPITLLSRSWTQTHTVTQNGGPGTATLTFTAPVVLGGLGTILQDWFIPAPSGWAASASSHGRKKTVYVFTRSFPACTAPITTTFTVEYTPVAGALLAALLGLRWTVAVSPN
jgi:hypothetical protein